MMKYLLLTVCYFSIINFLSAQTHWIGIKAGPQWSSVFSDNVSSHHTIKERKGNTAAIVFEKILNEDYIFGMELLYDQRGYMFDIAEHDNMGNETGNFYPGRFNYDYISYLLKLGMITGKSFRFFVDAGIGPGVLYKGLMILPKRDFNTNLVTGTITYDNSVNVRNIDLVGIAEAGFDYALVKKVRIFTSCRYQYSFLKTKELGYMIQTKVRNYAIAVTGGIKLNLNHNRIKR